MDAQQVVGVVAIINALAAAIALIISTWFAARGRSRYVKPSDEEQAPPAV